MPTRDAQRNCSGYLGFAIASRKTFPVPSLSPDTHLHLPEHHGHTWESRNTFPGEFLPILQEEGKTIFLELLDHTGETVERFPLQEVILPSRRSPSPLHLFDVFSDTLLCAIGDATGTWHCFSVKIKGAPILLGQFAPRGRTTLYGRFSNDGTIVLLEEKGPGETILHLFSPDGAQIAEQTLWPPGLGTKHSQIVDGKALLSTLGNLVLRYKLPQGELTGAYVFPEGHDLSTGVFVHQNKGLTFLRNPFGKEEGIEKLALVAFDVLGESWPLPVELVSVSPHGESLYEVFEDLPTDLRFTTIPSLEKLLTVSVEAVSITRKEERLTFTWLTPELQNDTPRTVTVTASLGPARKAFPMTVVPFPNPLSCNPDPP